MANPEDAIQSALDAGGNVFIDEGEYYLSNNFAGFTMPKRFTKVECSRMARFWVPNDYTGFFLKTGDNYCEWEGGQVREKNNGAHQWTAIMAHGDNTSTQCHTHHLNIFNCGTAIEIKTETPEQWTNSNIYSNISVFAFRRGIVFNSAAPYRTNRNIFREIVFQPTVNPIYATTELGIQLDGRMTEMHSVFFYDWQNSKQFFPNSLMCHILPNADKCLAIGGIVSDPLAFQDDSTRKNCLFMDWFAEPWPPWKTTP